MAGHTHCYFLNLPTELRLHIYDVVFASLANKAAPKEMTNATAILRTSSALFKEASSSFNQFSQALGEQLDTTKDKAGDSWYEAEEGPEAKVAWQEYLRLLNELREMRKIAMQAEQFKDGDECWWLVGNEKKYARNSWWKWRLFASIFDLMRPFAKLEFSIETARLRKQYHEDSGP